MSTMTEAQPALRRSSRISCLNLGKRNYSDDYLDEDLNETYKEEFQVNFETNKKIKVLPDASKNVSSTVKSKTAKKSRDELTSTTENPSKLNRVKSQPVPITPNVTRTRPDKGRRPYIPFSRNASLDSDHQVSVSSVGQNHATNLKHDIAVQQFRQQQDSAPLFSKEEQLEADKMNLRVLMLSIDCPLCSKPLDGRKELVDHLMEVHKKPPYKCRAIGCDMWFERECFLGKHVRTYHSHLRGQWPCEDCKGLYISHNRLYGHILDQHTFGQYCCAFPGCSFGPERTRKNVLQHYVRVHFANRFKCRFCSKPFNMESGLRNHERMHLGYRPFQCKWPRCRHATVVKCSLITHIRTVHFKVPRSLKEQLERNGKLDDRDPYQWVKVVGKPNSTHYVPTKSTVKRTKKRPKVVVEKSDQDAEEEMVVANDESYDADIDKERSVEQEHNEAFKLAIANENARDEDEVPIETVEYTAEADQQPAIIEVHPTDLQFDEYDFEDDYLENGNAVFEELSSSSSVHRNEPEIEVVNLLTDEE